MENEEFIEGIVKRLSAKQYLEYAAGRSDGMLFPDTPSDPQMNNWYQFGWFVGKKEADQQRLEKLLLK